MTTNPYAQMGGPNSNFGGGDFTDPLPSRTSVLAVLSLVLALICFIPIFPPLAIMLGGAAVLFISTSQGRLRGMGLAITGIVLGLLFTLLWIFIIVGAQQAGSMFTTQFVKPAGSTMAAIQAGDFKTARASFTPAANQHITDAMFADFAKRYQAEVGAFKSTPDSLWELGSAYGQVGPAMNSLQGRQNVIPFPGSFEKGHAAIAIEIDPVAMGNQPSPNSSFNFPIVNLGVSAVGGQQVIWLIDPKDVPALLQSGTAPALPGTTPTPADPADPADPDANP